MRAIRIHGFGDPNVMKLEEIDVPSPAAGQVLVRIRAAGVNPVDTYIRAGLYGDRPFPLTLGFDAAGTVEAVGAGVDGRCPGDRVYVAGSVSGTYAEFALCEASQVHSLPSRLTFAQGAGVFIPYGTAYRALHQLARAIPGETLLVHGASGGVGLAAVQIGRAAGLRVIGTVGSDPGAQLVAREGAHHVVRHNLPGYTDQIMGITGGRGADVVLEMLANVNLSKDLQLIATGGRIVVIGCRGNVELNPRDAMRREAHIIGMVLFNAAAHELASLNAGLIAGLENGTFRPVVGREMPLTDAPLAHRTVMEPGAYGKIVLIT